MAGADTRLAASALAIALVALLIALCQLLQQYFATADGYRRCQKRVMGPWASRTRLHFRKSEFRFETLFTTPEIYLTGDGAPGKFGEFIIDGSPESRRRTFTPTHAFQSEVYTRGLPAWNRAWSSHTGDAHPGSGRFNDDVVCWLPFLYWIHNTSEAAMPPEQRHTFGPPLRVRIPALVFRERSWDFQPPDVVRPFAKSTVSDIAIIARRMGMKWKDFRPADGIMRAEGHSHIITSTVIRSLGILLQYSYTGQNQRLRYAEFNLGRIAPGSIDKEQEEVYIPRARADRLGCGVIRPEPQLCVPDFTVGTPQEIAIALDSLDTSGQSFAILRDMQIKDPDLRFRVADIVAMSASMIHHRGSDLVQIPAPSDNVNGFTTSPVGRRAFRSCLESYVKNHAHVGLKTKEVLQTCRELKNRYTEWEGQGQSWIVRQRPIYLDTLDSQVESLTTYLGNLARDKAPFLYINLLGAHIRFAVFRSDGETSPMKAEAPNYKEDMKGYFDQLPEIVRHMETTGVKSLDAIDAWAAMMLRACCWGACHFFVPGERVPMAYYGSQLPVYIG
ncbi:uncharacterized protein N7496_004936 [Penicillium cataractarum]|uniref:Uncharacterized protein n=1 Tax=Penicillium cataractarum TaxID=2100454 RepID=A0A9W9SF81_9EURO|nr:uncharacterized protein N7496_004936 [Penicillium cataractarum]KAJ5377527.1 hypothetical protein N7496_004936 [Penicillium cataractarum]